MPLGTVTGTMQEFIDWALTIVSIMILWYIGKFFFVAPPTKEEREAEDREYAEKGAAVRKWFKTKQEKKEAEEERGRRKDLTSPVRDYVVKAMSGLSEVENSLNELNGGKARKQVKEVQGHLKKAIRSSHLLLRNLEAEDRDDVVQVINFLQATQKGFLEDVKDKIPQTITSRADIRTILDNFAALRGSLGNVFKKLEMMHARK